MDLQAPISQINFISLPFIRRLQRLEFKYGKAMKIQQYTIDALQEWPDDLERELDKGEIFPDTAGAFCYKLNAVLEIMNPELTEDIAAFKDMSTIAEEWREEVEKNMKADE